MNWMNFSRVALAAFAIMLFALLGSVAPLTNVPAQAPLKLQIAFASKRDGWDEFYVMDEGGKDRRNLTNHSANDCDPAWSLDAQQIVFQWDGGGPGGHDGPDIYVMNADGQNVRRLTDSLLAIVDPRGPLMLPRLLSYPIEALQRSV